MINRSYLIIVKQWLIFVTEPTQTQGDVTCPALEKSLLL